MKNDKISFAVVTNSEEELIGIVTMGDIANELLGRRNEK